MEDDLRKGFFHTIVSPISKLIPHTSSTLNFSHCNLVCTQELAHLLEDTPMPIRDKFMFVLSPVDPRKAHDVKALQHVS